jgi:hypothetical protein
MNNKRARRDVREPLRTPDARVSRIGEPAYPGQRRVLTVMKKPPSVCISAETLIAGTDQRGVLWSALTARRMTAMIAADAEAGLLPCTEAMELIDRVWTRAARS